MIQQFIIHEHHPRLLIFFAGWAADETPFATYRPAHCDLMICYDYRDLEWDASLTENYQEVHVVGWSMGVWAAAHLPQLMQLPLGKRVAINGSPYPVDDTRGIPRAIFQGTIDNLNGPSLHKFLRRMCDDTAAFRGFLAVTPRRPLEEIGEELVSVQLQVQTQQRKGEAPLPIWQEAIVGSNDRIIPPENQLNAWKQLQVPVQHDEHAHYHEPLFRHYLQDVWTNN